MSWDISCCNEHSDSINLGVNYPVDSGQDENLKTIKDKNEICDIFGTFAITVPHINIGLNTIILPQISLQSYLEAATIECRSINSNDNALDLIQLYKDIEKANNLQLNVEWKTKNEQEENDNYRKVNINELLQMFPKPNYDDIIKLHDALDTTYHQSIYRETQRLNNFKFCDIIDKYHYYQRDHKLQQKYLKLTNKSKNNDRKIQIINSGNHHFSYHFNVALRKFMDLNDEYQPLPIIFINDQQRNLQDVIETFCISNNDITNHHKALIDQKGVRSKLDIPQFTVLGQYLGNEISEKIYGEIYECSSGENVHGRYAFDIKNKSISFVIDPLPLQLNNSNFTQWQYNGIIFIYINDCRENIEKCKLSSKDEEFYNIEFVKVLINDWPQIYMITTKNIKAGKQLFTYYGNQLSEQVKTETGYNRRANQLKHRLDSKHSILQKLFNS